MTNHQPDQHTGQRQQDQQHAELSPHDAGDDLASDIIALSHAHGDACGSVRQGVDVPQRLLTVVVLGQLAESGGGILAQKSRRVRRGHR